VEEDGRNNIVVVCGVEAEGVSIAVGEDNGDDGGDGPGATGVRGSRERKRETNKKEEQKTMSFLLFKFF